MFALWVYIHFSNKIAKRKEGITDHINKGIGFVLSTIGLFQLIRILI